jgi:predicted GNAT superfamily acetyltransferase
MSLSRIRRARDEELPTVARLLARNLRFTDADAIPAWFMRTTNEGGGITLVAACGQRIAGASYAMPAVEDRTAILFSCGLVVDRDYRGQRLGARLKLVQRSEALAMGYRRIRWTTDPLNGRALSIYLSELGARIVGYRAGLHDGLRTNPGHPQDDLDIVWHLAGSKPIDPADVHVVDLPWTAGGNDLDQRSRVGREMSELLADGYVGCTVVPDRDARICRITFGRECG